MDAFDRIAGAEKLTSIFGYWPSFHDAEVVWLRMDRRPAGDDYGPTVDMLIHVFEMTNEVGTDGMFVLQHHTMVHFVFRDVVELNLKGFNHQNALHGLLIMDIRSWQLERVHFQITLDASWGVAASWQCHEVEVLSVTPGDPAPD